MRGSSRILIVDDRPSNLQALEDILADLDCTTVLASSGQEALDLATMEPDWAAILLDVVMPGLDGIQTGKRMRQFPSLQLTPLLFMTGMASDPEMIARAYELGAVDYMVKPIVPEIVRGKLQFFLDLHRNQIELCDQRKLLERYARELDRVNSNLQDFAYAASHDLKSPLLAIKRLVNWLEEDAGTSLDTPCREHLGRMRRRVVSMETLIQDLLEFCRAGATRESLESVDTRALVEGLFDVLNVPEDFEITVNDSLPVLTTFRVPLEQIFRNLIGNAIKHHTGPAGRVEVSARVEECHVEFSVSDDGPGIAPEYQERVFQLFQTLRGKDEVEGTGIGLSVVKKIVESQEGTLRVESREGEGATFHFTWPLEPISREAQGTLPVDGILTKPDSGREDQPGELVPRS